jgi:hypothetical protein
VLNGSARQTITPIERMDGRVLIGVIGIFLLAAAAYEYSLVQGLAPAA